MLGMYNQFETDKTVLCYLPYNYQRRQPHSSYANNLHVWFRYLTNDRYCRNVPDITLLPAVPITYKAT